MQRKVFIPEGLTVNHPFFYIIQHLPSGKLYAGYCCAKKHCDSSILMTVDGYKTSSKYIREIIKETGLSSFKTLRVRHFISRVDAQKHEINFLKRVDAMRNSLFINRSNGDRSFRYLTHTEEAKEKMRNNSMRGKKCKPRSEEHKRRLSKANSGKTLPEEQRNKIRESMMGKPGPNKGKKHTEEQRRKIGDSLRGRKRGPYKKRIVV